jgi:hypothetical protein
VREVWIPIVRHPGRSTLLVLTFALGFASVLATVATIEGGRRSIREDVMSLGVDVIAALNPIEMAHIPLLGALARGKRPIDAPAASDLGIELGDTVRAVIPLRMELVLVRAEERAVATTAMATTPRFEGVLRTGLLAGRFLDGGDRVHDDPEIPVPAVLDEALARELGGDPAAHVGRELTLLRDGRPGRVRIVGVLRDPISLRRHLEAFDGQARARAVTARRLEFKNIYLPWRAAVDAPSGVLVQLHDPDDAEAVLPRLEAFFAERSMSPYYHVQRRWVDFVIEIVDRFSSLSHFIWVVDLLVVVILTATISLLSVDERAGEVALRRAEGATRAQVVLPLLGEATLLAILSIPLGYAIGSAILEYGIRPVLDWPPHLPPLAVWGTPASIVAAAWLAHLLPARRIARLEPAAVLAEHRE